MSGIAHPTSLFPYGQGMSPGAQKVGHTEGHGLPFTSGGPWMEIHVFGMGHPLESASPQQGISSGEHVTGSGGVGHSRENTNGRIHASAKSFILIFGDISNF